MSWARAIELEPEAHPDLLESFLRRGIDACTQSTLCETVRASFPGEQEHTNAVLRTIGGSDN